MSRSNSRLPSPFDEGDEAQGSLHGYGSLSNHHPANDLALRTFHAHSFSTSGSPSNLLSGVPQASSPMAPDPHNQQMALPQYRWQLDQATSTTFPVPGREALLSVHSQLYGGPVLPLPFSTPVIDKGEWFYGQQPPPVQPGVYQTDGLHIPDAKGMATKQDWTELHTQTLEECKRLGLTVPQIVQVLWSLDGKTWSENSITKRWAKLREKCVPKHERDEFMHHITPVVTQSILDAVTTKLLRERALNEAGQLPDVEQAVKNIVSRHAERLLHEIVMTVFDNKMSFEQWNVLH